MDGMTTSQLPAPTTLQPVTEDKSLLTVIESGASCCGGSACGTGD
jgi:hypothetical protein